MPAFAEGSRRCYGGLVKLIAVSLLSFLSLGACGDEPAGDDAGTVIDGSFAYADAGAPIDVYDPDHLLTVEITLPSESWDALREQTRVLADTLGGDCLAAPFGSPFTWFEAAVTIDGTRFERVDVRKKGFLGSLSTTRPSLKFDIGEFVDEQTYGGVRRLTLNNSREDPALIRQ
ncbi:MAG: spore coat protein H, partial [Polyangiales bacterium]